MNSITVHKKLPAPSPPRTDPDRDIGPHWPADEPIRSTGRGLACASQPRAAALDRNVVESCQVACGQK